MKESEYFIELEEEGFRKVVSYTPNRPDKNVFLYYLIPRRAAIVWFMSFFFCPSVCFICFTNFFSPPYCMPAVFLRFPVFLDYSSLFYIHSIFIQRFC